MHANANFADVVGVAPHFELCIGDRTAASRTAVSKSEIKVTWWSQRTFRTFLVNSTAGDALRTLLQSLKNRVTREALFEAEHTTGKPLL